MKLLKTINLKATKGTELIKDAGDVFTGYISSDFEKYTEKSKPTKKITLVVSEMDEDGTYRDIFLNPEKQAMTQNQIIEFCKNYKDYLRKNRYATFFLFKEKEEFFVAIARFDDYGRLGVDVYEFSGGYVWNAEYRHHVVSPQLDSKSLSPKSLDSLNLSNFVPRSEFEEFKSKVEKILKLC